MNNNNKKKYELAQANRIEIGHLIFEVFFNLQSSEFRYSKAQDH